MDAAEILKAAKNIQNELVAHRRTLHKNPEVGSHLPHTTEYVMQQLKTLGYKPVRLCDSGIVATITGQNTGRCILLRADMDALAVTEETQLDFQSTNGNMHACGHDMHTAMLLGTAALLQKFRHELCGTVKLVFQPDEEGFSGAKSMLEAGVLENPVPQAGLALHVHSGTPSGMILCGKGSFMAGCTVFRITVTGLGCHGAMPETGIDPINAAAHIYCALQTILCREISPKEPLTITIGSFQAGHGPNILPQETVLEGTIRSFRQELSQQVFNRIRDISQHIAAGLRCQAEVTMLASAPPLENNPQLTEEIAAYAESLVGAPYVIRLDEGGMGSEDFAAYTHKIPCAYLLLGAGTEKENPLYGKPMHNEHVVFNEEILSIGTALETYSAIALLKKQAP